MIPRLRQSARNRDCTLRLRECNRNPATVILAHALSGPMGSKCSDTLAFFCCSSCHDVFDRRHPAWMEYGRDVLRSEALRAVGETHAIWLREGLLR